MIDILNTVNDSILPWVGKTAKMLSCFINEYFEERAIDLTKEQWVLLLHLYVEDGRIQNDLAIITERNKASLTRLISAMEKKNFVLRVPSRQDKRVKYVYITTLGKEIFEQTLPLMDTLKAILHKDITAEEIEVVIRVLRKLQNNINSYDQNSCSTN